MGKVTHTRHVQVVALNWTFDIEGIAEYSYLLLEVSSMPFTLV